MSLLRRSQSSPRPRSRSRAQALAEFALVAPIFFLILFGIIDFGRYVYYTQILNNAAREGARYAIVHGELGVPKTGPPNDPAGTAVINVVRNYAIGVIGLEDAAVLDIDPSWEPANNKRGTKVTVEVTYDFHSVIPLVPIPPITVRGASTLVINN
ncbi:MAG TPA: TadE/TadG family type IV pilus assembly protein [Candidatus Limnocylindrales bacterium]|nr:TadE/TadG family type IV pilus assembly protein [Candidatus Limnocylindrales bacterium]